MDVNFHVHVRVGPRFARGALALGLLLWNAAELASESVTLNTYYPAPSGVYNSLIATQSSYLASKGGKVGIATTAPANLLDVNGNVDVRGTLGVGTTTPAASAALDVTSANKGFLVPRMAVRPAAPAAGLQIYNTGTNVLEYWNGTSWVSASSSFPACVDYTRSGAQLTSVSCTPQYPNALRGGCAAIGCYDGWGSNIAYLSRNELVSNVQYCAEEGQHGSWCVNWGQNTVVARITCCK